MHSAVGAPYAHVTAPIRRLADRAATEVCVALAAGAQPPAWARAALPELPGLMADSDKRAHALERAVVDATEAWLLSGREGQEFGAVVLDGGPERGTIVLDSRLSVPPASRRTCRWGSGCGCGWRRRTWRRVRFGSYASAEPAPCSPRRQPTLQPTSHPPGARMADRESSETGAGRRDAVRGLTVAVLGGTGEQGYGLARRFAAAGLRVLIGSRLAERAARSVGELRRAVPDGEISGGVNAEVAAAADFVIVAVPYDGHAATLGALREALAGKIVVDCVNPLGFDSRGAYPLAVPEGSAAAQAAALLPDSRVVAAFHHVSAPLLADPAVASVELDVLVLGDDREATDTVQALAAVIPGMRGIYGGRLRNAGQVEAFTANLVSINRRYRAHAGIRVTDV